MTITITKAHLIQQLEDGPDLNHRDATNIVELFFDEIHTSLAQGFSIKLSGFGNFVLRDKASRPGRNPKTGESKIVSARRVVVFRPGLKLKRFIQKNYPDDISE